MSSNPNDWCPHKKRRSGHLHAEGGPSEDTGRRWPSTWSEASGDNNPSDTPKPAATRTPSNQISVAETSCKGPFVTAAELSNTGLKADASRDAQ